MAVLSATTSGVLMSIEVFKLLNKQIITTIVMIFSTFPLLVSANQIDKATAMIKRLDTRFSDMASTNKVGTMGLDSMNNFFESVQKKIPAIETLMRINSNGVVINEISALQNNYKMRNVSDQKWFLQVKSTRSPYYGLNRDSTGSASFFWAWPILSDDSSFNGAISAKIKPSEILKMASVNETTPIAIIFNTTNVYTRNSLENISTQKDTVLLSKQSKIIIQSPSILNTQPIKDSTQNSSLSTSGDNPIPPPVTASQPSQETTHSSDKDTLHEVAQSAPVVYKSDFIEPSPSKKHSSATIFYTLILTLLFLAAAFFIIMKYKKSVAKKSFSLPEIDSFDLTKAKVGTVLLQDDTLDIVDAPATRPVEAILDDIENPEDSLPNPDFMSLPESDEETKTHHPEVFQEIENQTVFKEPDKQIDTTDPLEQKLRRELYREIHNQIMQWVVGESARLSGRIEELNERLEKSESGNTPELEQIRQEAHEISKEIELFKTHLTNKE
jgi:hypothetical protein